MLDKVLRHRLPVWLGLLALLLGLFAPAARAAEDYLEPEAAFRFALNEDAMGTEKLAEGIRAFAVDSAKLDALIEAQR